jgi:hypothetical protein
MPTTPFESIALGHLTNVTGGCKKQQPPPQQPQQAAPSGGFEAETNVQLVGFGGQAATQTG